MDDQAEESARATDRKAAAAADAKKARGAAKRRGNQNANNPLFKGYEALLDIDESQIDEAVPLPKGACLYVYMSVTLSWSKVLHIALPIKMQSFPCSAGTSFPHCKPGRYTCI